MWSTSSIRKGLNFQKRLGPSAGSDLSVGAPRSEIVRWSSDGRSLIDPPMPGDRVALHWDWICDTVTEEQCALIESHERAYRRGLAIS